MIRHQIVLKRQRGSLLDTLPLRDVALAYIQSVEGLGDVQVEYASNKQAVISFVWEGDGDPAIPDDLLDRYGLKIDG